jgi:hypothetical protein
MLTQLIVLMMVMMKLLMMMKLMMMVTTDNGSTLLSAMRALSHFIFAMPCQVGPIIIPLLQGSSLK